jgi:hypothetical protein
LHLRGELGRRTVRRCLDDDQRRNQLRARGGTEKRGIATHGLPDQNDGCQLQLVDYMRDIRDERAAGDVGGTSLATAMTTLIEREDAITPAETSSGVGPFAGVTGEAVQTYDRLAVSAKITTDQPSPVALKLNPGQRAMKATPPVAQRLTHSTAMTRLAREP